MTPKRRFFSAFLVAAPLIVGVFVGGCNKEPAPPPAGMPPLAGGAAVAADPHSQGMPGATGMNAPPLPPGAMNPHGGALPAGHPPMPIGDSAGGMAMPQADSAAVDPSQHLIGKITAADSVKSAVKPGDVLFLVARADDGSERGPILGVKRYEFHGFPIEFAIDGRDAMSANTKFEGKVVLSARIDKDGDAITKNPGDVLGIARLTVPNSDVKLVLDTITK